MELVCCPDYRSGSDVAFSVLRLPSELCKSVDLGMVDNEFLMRRGHIWVVDECVVVPELCNGSVKL